MQGRNVQSGAAPPATRGVLLGPGYLVQGVVLVGFAGAHAGAQDLDGLYLPARLINPDA